MYSLLTVVCTVTNAHLHSHSNIPHPPTSISWLKQTQKTTKRKHFKSRTLILYNTYVMYMMLSYAYCLTLPQPWANLSTVIYSKLICAAFYAFSSQVSTICLHTIGKGKVRWGKVFSYKSFCDINPFFKTSPPPTTFQDLLLCGLTLLLD